MARLTTLPTIPDDRVPDFFEPSLGVAPESDYRCNLGQPQRDNLDVQETPEAALLPPSGPANRELSITDLLRHPIPLSENTTVGTAAKLFASGMQPPVVLVTQNNVPLGLVDPATVLQQIRGRTVEEIEQTRLLDVLTPRGLRVAEDASVLQAAEHFVCEECDALVVIDRDGQLAGVLMARDLFLNWL